MKSQSQFPESATSVESETSSTLPAAFCWTKMGTEAGQPLAVILKRKEAERQLGNGTFYWGIGNALGQKIWALVDGISQPKIVFTGIKSKAKAIDARPGRVVAWTAYYDRWGCKHQIPSSAFVTSRADTIMGTNQPRYALVSNSSSPLTFRLGAVSFHSRNLVNYGQKTMVAPSQVTAIVEYLSKRDDSGLKYDVVFVSNLVWPFYVKLSDPVEVSSSVLTEINRMPLDRNFSATNWRIFLDERFEYRKSYSTQKRIPPANQASLPGRQMAAPEIYGQVFAG